MKRSEMFMEELRDEAKITRRFLDALPDSDYGWRPHEKSMTLERLVNHVIELPGWIAMILATEELDFAKEPYQPEDSSDKAVLKEQFEKAVKDGLSALESAGEDEFDKNWTLRAGEQIFSTSPKWKMIRHSLNQLTHHRAQLGVYFRLLDVEVPSSYGGSADDDTF